MSSINMRKTQKYKRNGSPLSKTKSTSSARATTRRQPSTARATARRQPSTARRQPSTARQHTMPNMRRNQYPQNVYHRHHTTRTNRFRSPPKKKKQNSTIKNLYNRTKNFFNKLRF